MALKGEIGELNYIEILALSTTVKRRDITVLFENDSGIMKLYLREGKPIFGESGDVGEEYLRWLVESGIVRDEDVTAMKSDSSFIMSDQLSILEYFADKGIANMELLTTFAYEQTQEIIMEVSSWTDGTFELIFEDHNFKSLQLNPVEMNRDVQTKAAKARNKAKVINDKSAITDEMVFDINPQFSSSIGEITLNTLQWRIISLVDGKKSLRYISRFLDASDEEIKSSLSDLLSKNLIEIAGERIHSGAFKPASEKVILPFSPLLKEESIKIDTEPLSAEADIKNEKAEVIKPAEVVAAGGEEDKVENVVLGQGMKRDPNLSRRLIVKIIDSITDL